jgi:hypothetical protein
MSPLRGIRFRCNTCEYDLCSICFNYETSHDSEHIFEAWKHEAPHKNRLPSFVDQAFSFSPKDNQETPVSKYGLPQSPYKPVYGFDLNSPFLFSYQSPDLTLQNTNKEKHPVGAFSF